MQNTEATYDGIEDIAANIKPPREDLPFLEEGEYPDFEVTGLRDGFTNIDGRQFLVIEGVVCKSEGPKATAPGTKSVIILKKGLKDAKYNYFLKDVTKLVAALLNEPFANVTSESVMKLVRMGREGKLPPMRIAISMKTKEGGSFVNPTFRSIEGVSGKL